MDWIKKQDTINHVSFSEEFYVADGRLKEIDAQLQANVRVCSGLGTPLLMCTFSLPQLLLP